MMDLSTPPGDAGEQSAGRADRVDVNRHAANIVRWRELSRERNQALATRRRRRRTAQPTGPAGGDGAAGERRERRRYPWWIEVPALIVIAFVVTFLIQTFIARVYYVPSASMEPTLHGTPHGVDRILAYKLGYDFGSPSQGDVVVFAGPPSWTP
jgi:hypothetical protein